MNLRGHLAVIGATTTVWTLTALAISSTPITLSVAIMTPIVAAVESSILWGLTYGAGKLAQKAYSSAKNRAQQVDMSNVKDYAASALSESGRYLGNLWPQKKAAANVNPQPVTDPLANISDIEQPADIQPSAEEQQKATRRRSTRKK